MCVGGRSLSNATSAHFERRRSSNRRSSSAGSPAQVPACRNNAAAVPFFGRFVDVFRRRGVDVAFTCTICPLRNLVFFRKTTTPFLNVPVYVITAPFRRHDTVRQKRCPTLYAAIRDQ